MRPFFKLLDTENEETRQAIRSPLAQFNDQHIPNSRSTPILIPLEEGEKGIVGGLLGYTVDEWLYVEALVVPDCLRGKGWGRRLLGSAEDEALIRGCHSSWLGTFEFQARAFYERMGYECFASLPKHPGEHTLFFMKKALRPSSV